MRYFLLASLALGLTTTASLTLAEDIVPQKTWDTPTQTRPIQPFNLKSMLRGEKQRETEPAKQLPTSRNVFEMIANGEDLPHSEALLETADSNDLRAQLRMYNPFSDQTVSEEKIEEMQLALFEEEAQKIDKQMKRRNKFYIEHGISDQYAREYRSSTQGKLLVRDIRKQKEEEKKQLAQQEKEDQAALKRYNTEEDQKTKTYHSVDIVPTAQPNENGEIKPFFYR